MKYDIITFGSATRDVYIISDFLVVGQKKFITGKGIYLSLGSKIDVDDIMFRSGGGGANTAFTFNNQGFKVAWCGMIGKDLGGGAIINHLKSVGIETSFILQTDKKPTNYSVVLTAPGKERTILVYRGASNEFTEKDIIWDKLKAGWFYLAPLSGKSCGIFEKTVNFAKAHKIKIAVNPGQSQLSLPKATLKRILPKIDILVLNQEEASILTGVSFKQDKLIMEELKKMCQGIIIITKGRNGVEVFDGHNLYSASIINSKVVDRTGAGDAFASGFLADFIRTGNIQKAIQLGMANASSCLTEWGAQEGLLKKGQSYLKVKVLKYL